MKKRICIISFSPIYRDARVLRQIEYLSPHYQVSVIGYGQRPGGLPDIQWSPVEPRTTRVRKVLQRALMVLGRLVPRLYDLWYWQRPDHKAALSHAVNSHADAFHANDWTALPIAAEAARRFGSKVVLDAHEYSPLELEVFLWRLFYAPLIVHVLRKYAPAIDASITVAPGIADRYKREFGLEPITVLNAPKLVPMPTRELDPRRIRLVHHGLAARDRQLEKMIETLARTDEHFELHLFLVDDGSGYLEQLRSLASKVAPNRVLFHDPVSPEEIVPTIAEYDIGFYLLEPSSYNNRMALPNKFFDFLAAGLAVCVGPSPAMAEMVITHRCGCVTPTFDPADAAATLNTLSTQQIKAMQEAARNTAKQFNADCEMRKLVQLYERLFEMSDKVART